MQLFVIGDFRDVTGFALAGIPGVVCSTAAGVQESLRRACADPEIGLVLVSAASATLAPAAVSAAADWQRHPIVIVLPGEGR